MKAVDKADAKGVKDTIDCYGQNSLVVNAKITVITALKQQRNEGKCIYQY